MCSVVGCYSEHRDMQRFKLPEDPERRLEWVQFLAAVNKQRFKESSWTDITICREHFEENCFERIFTVDLTGKVQRTLKPGAVPSVGLRSESDKPKPHVDRPRRVEPVEVTKVACQRTKSKTAARERPGPKGISRNNTDAFLSVLGQMHPKNVHIDKIREKAALLRMKGRYVVNEKRLLQLFNCKCPLCGSEVKVEKVTSGVLIILNQQCIQCEYRNQWKSQKNASVPAAEDQHLTNVTAVTPEPQQAAPTDDTHNNTTRVSEIDAVIDEESDPMVETDGSGDQDDVDSDEDWEPARNFLKAGVPQKETDEETQNQEVERDDCPPPISEHIQLCTECGMFFNKHKPHMCEHKSKPYSCIICGKRCVSEAALTFHSRVHDENYEHRCKYCHVAFRTKVDKHKHEQTHFTQGKPYKCPDCSETFPTNKERRIHLEDHRGPRQLKCDHCGIEFLSPDSLQRHLPVHTGVRSFKCSVCQRGFKQPSHLKSHMRLHTGERPYKCQHCDQCFNHNVSLKSHVQRYHSSSSSSSEQKKEKINKRESDNGDAEVNGDKKDKDSEDDNSEEQVTDEDTQEVKADMLRIKKRSTGRPIGRPKRNAADNLVDGEEETSEKLTSSTGRSRRKTKNCDSDSDFNPREKKKKRFSIQIRGKSSRKRRGRPSKSLVV